MIIYINILSLSVLTKVLLYLKLSLQYNPIEPETWRAYNKSAVANHLEDPQKNELDVDPQTRALFGSRTRNFFQRVIDFNSSQTNLTQIHNLQNIVRGDLTNLSPEQLFSAMKVYLTLQSKMEAGYVR